jgi:hypothetical protein
MPQPTGVSATGSVAPARSALVEADPCRGATRPVEQVWLTPRDLDALAIVASGTSAWVAVGGQQAGKVFRLDDDGGAVEVATVGWAPEAIAVGPGALWVSNSIGDGSHPSTDPAQNTVARLDLASGQIRTMRIQEPGPIAAVGEGAWVATGTRGVVHLTRALVPSPPYSKLDGGPAFMRSGSDAAFLTTADAITAASSLWRLGNDASEVVLRLRLAVPAGAALVSDGTVLLPVGQPDGSWALVNVDRPASARTLDLPESTDARSFAVGEAGVGWAFTTDGCIFTFGLGATIQPREAWMLTEPDTDLLALAIGDRRVWILTSNGVAALQP